MKLLHSFPRPRRDPVTGGRLRKDPESDARALSVLESVLSVGLLCAPEPLAIHPDPATGCAAKNHLMLTHKPEYIHTQSRFCATLCTEAELYEPKIRGLGPGENGPVQAKDRIASHAGLFGPSAIAFDPIVARRLGFAPTFYFAPNDMSGSRFFPDSMTIPGLGVQIIQRLKELRELMVLLAIIERSFTVDGHTFASEQVIKELGLELRYQPELTDAVWKLDDQERFKVFQLLNTDRDEALGLVGFTDMMLSLFQETDSTLDGSVLAFYQQREWRLIHAMRQGTYWYCLGQQPAFRNPLAEVRRHQIDHLRSLLNKAAGKERHEDYFRHCWILESVDGFPVRDYLSDIIVPRRTLPEAVKLARRYGCNAPIAVAEDYGFDPRCPV